MALRIFTAVALCMLATSSIAADRFEESARALRDATSEIQGAIEQQRQCIAALKANQGYVTICNSATHAYIEAVVMKSMSVYLDEVGEYAAIHRSIKALDVANDFLFYHDQANALSDEITRRTTDEQLSAMLNAL